MARADSSGARHWLVDGMNVIGARPDAWWRDREGAMRALVDSLVDHSAESGDSFTLVLDGRPKPSVSAPPQSTVEVVFAPGGPGAADDAIARLVEAEPDPARVVVTSDAELAARVRARGAVVMGAGRFRQWLEGALGEPG